MKIQKCVYKTKSKKLELGCSNPAVFKIEQLDIKSDVKILCPMHFLWIAKKFEKWFTTGEDPFKKV